jgi:hypothetical protein
MQEDVLRIMKMVEEGKIDAQKGAELIEALNGSRIEEKPKLNDTFNASKINLNDERMLKVRVISSKKDNVNIQLPVKLVKGVIAACGKLPMNVHGLEGLDMQMLLEALDSGLIGKIVDVKTEEGDIIEVVVE